MAGLTRAEQVIKYLVMIFNFFFLVAGLAMFAVGLWLRFDQKTQVLTEDPDSASAFFKSVYILLAAGALLIVVGLLGCCGTIKESQWMLAVLFFFLLLIFVAVMAAGIYGLSNKEKVVKNFQKFYKETYKNYHIDTNQKGHSAIKATLKAIQIGLNCCDKIGDKKDHCSKTATTDCPDAINNMFNSKLLLIGGGGIGIALIMIFGMIFSMMLCCAIKRNQAQK